MDMAGDPLGDDSVPGTPLLEKELILRMIDEVERPGEQDLTDAKLSDLVGQYRMTEIYARS